ncbi:MAG TPA: hypothetical protein VGH43_01300 [Jatrophihabitans sp.]|jgi:hypothetical protein
MQSGPVDVRSEIKDALRNVLMEKIRRDHYPSATMMDAVEVGIGDEQLVEYAEILLDKLESDEFPSIDLMKRLHAL